MNPPDYTQYSIDELKQALNSIDKVAFPARTKQIEEEIISRINNSQWVKKEIKTKIIEYDISSISNSLEKSHFLFFLIDQNRVNHNEERMEIASRPDFFMWMIYIVSIYIVIQLTRGYNKNSYEFIEYLILMTITIVFIIGARSYHRVVVIDKVNKTAQTLNSIFGFSFLKKKINIIDKPNLIFYRVIDKNGFVYYIYLKSGISKVSLYSALSFNNALNIAKIVSVYTGLEIQYEGFTKTLLDLVYNCPQPPTNNEQENLEKN